MLKTPATQTLAPELATEVEALLDTAEPEGAFDNSAECAALLLLAGALLLSPPEPKPKKS
jgi:3-oxoacyl-[acyl-carrier-protein] synthase III